MSVAINKAEIYLLDKMNKIPLRKGPFPEKLDELVLDVSLPNASTPTYEESC